MVIFTGWERQKLDAFHLQSPWIQMYIATGPNPISCRGESQLSGRDFMVTHRPLGVN